MNKKTKREDTTSILFFHRVVLYGISVMIKVLFQIVRLQQLISIIVFGFLDLCGTVCYKVRVLKKGI